MDGGHLPTSAAHLAALGYAVVRYTYKTVHLQSRITVMKVPRLASQSCEAAEYEFRVLQLVLVEASRLPALQHVEAWVLAGHSMVCTPRSAARKATLHIVEGCTGALPSVPFACTVVACSLVLEQAMYCTNL